MSCRERVSPGGRTTISTSSLSTPWIARTSGSSSVGNGVTPSAR
jgi:hypothetical protein